MASSKKGKRSARKSKAEQPERQTKKQIAIGRKQARQNRIIYISLAALAAVILIILAIGIVSELVIKPNQPVATVNGNNIPLDDYQDMLTYRRYNLHATINQLQATLDSLNPEDEQSELLRSIYDQQLQQTQTSLALAPQEVLDELIEDELIREETDALGLSVTGSEVEQAIFGDLQQALSDPPQTVVTGTEEIPTPTPIPQEQLEEVYASILNNIGISDSAFRSLIARGLLREKLQEYLADQVETTGQVAQVSLIETDTEEKALEAQQRIEGGEDFAIVAQEVSSDTLSVADGGDLGWVTADQLSARYGAEVASTAFDAAIDQVVVVQSGESHYLVVVRDRDENGPLPESVVLAEQNAALTNWLQEMIQSPDVEIERLLDDSQIPDDPFLVRSFQ